METIFDSILDAHEDLRGLMKTMTSTTTATAERESAFKKFAVELEAHAGAEERFLYSPVWKHDEGLEKSRHATYEHEEAEDLVKEAKKLDPKGKAFLSKMKEISKEVKHHMEGEEGEYFKITNKVLTPKEIKQANDQYLADYSRLKKKIARKG